MYFSSLNDMEKFIFIAPEEKEALAKQVFTFSGAIPTKSQVRSTSDAKRMDFGGVLWV